MIRATLISIISLTRLAHNHHVISHCRSVRRNFQAFKRQATDAHSGVGRGHWLTVFEVFRDMDYLHE